MSLHIIPPKRAIRHHAIRNVNPQGQEAPNAPEVEPPRGDITNDELKNAIKILTQFVANKVGQ